MAASCARSEKLLPDYKKSGILHLWPKSVILSEDDELGTDGGDHDGCDDGGGGGGGGGDDSGNDGGG